MWPLFPVACTDPGSLQPLVAPVPPGDPHVEVLHDGAVAAAVASGPDVLLALEEGWRWLDAVDEPDDLDGNGLPRAAVEVGGERFVLADTLRVLRFGEAPDAGLEALLPGAATDLCGDGDTVWISTDAGVTLWRSGQVLAVTLDGAPAPGPVACGGRLFDERVAWIADGTRVHALAGNGFAWAVFETHDLGHEVDALAVDRHGGAWVAAGGTLHHRGDAGWIEVALPHGAWDVHGGPDAGGVWVTTSLELLWVDVDGPQRPIGLDPGDARARTDGLGRLILRDDTGVRRVAMDRPLVVDGPATGAIVAEPTTITLIPTAREALESLSLELVEPAITLDLADGVATLDPAVAPGPVTLHAIATYADRQTIVERTLELVVAGGVTWTDHIGPIHAASCAVCHDGSTATVLDGPEAWQAAIESVVANIESSAMPLGGPPLPASDAALVRAWRDGGFLP